MHEDEAEPSAPGEPTATGEARGGESLIDSPTSGRPVSTEPTDVGKNSATTREASSEGGSQSSMHAAELERIDQDRAETALADPAPDDPASDTGHCLNCSSPLLGEFCHRCGQENRNLDIRFRELAHEWLGSVLGVDGRLWRTLKILVTKPGQLTLEFLEGRRVHFISPLRLYLITSLLLFLVLSLTGYSAVNSKDSSDGGNQSGLVFTFDDGDSENGDSEDAESDEAEVGAETSDTLEAVEPTGGPPSPDREPPDQEPQDQEPPGQESPGQESPGQESPGQESPEEPTASETDPTGDIDLEADAFSTFMEDVVGETLQQISEDKEGFNRSFQDNMARALFLMVPVFALQLWLLFRRRYRRYLYHLIFSLHFHAFFFLAIALTRPLDFALGYSNDGPIGNIATFGMLAYGFMALRRVYGDSRRRTAVKYLLLLFLHTFFIALFFLAIFVVTAMRNLS